MYLIKYYIRMIRPCSYKKSIQSTLFCVQVNIFLKCYWNAFLGCKLYVWPGEFRRGRSVLFLWTIKVINGWTKYRHAQTIYSKSFPRSYHASKNNDHFLVYYPEKLTPNSLFYRFKAKISNARYRTYTIIYMFFLFKHSLSTLGCNSFFKIL